MEAINPNYVYKGDEKVSRYHLAVVTARILANYEQNKASMSKEDFQKLSETWKQKYNVSVSFAFQELSNIPKGFTVPQDRKKMWVTN